MNSGSGKPSDRRAFSQDNGSERRERRPLKGTRNRRVRAVCCCLLTALLWAALAVGETAVTIEAGEWTWEPGGVSTFSGTVIPDRDLPEALLKLSVETKGENVRGITFLTLNGKKVKLRKRGPEATVEMKSGTPFSFEGQWTIPEETDSGLVYAEITLTVLDEQGEEAGRGILKIGSAEAENRMLEQTLTGRTDRLILILSAACAAVWVLAVGRHMILNRKKGQKG